MRHKRVWSLVLAIVMVLSLIPGNIQVKAEQKGKDAVEISFAESTVQAGECVELETVFNRELHNVSFYAYYRKGTSGDWTKYETISLGDEIEEGYYFYILVPTMDNMNSVQFQVDVNSDEGVFQSNIVTLSTTGTMISKQPKNKTAELGKTVSFTVEVTGNAFMDKFQWYYSKDNGSSWTKWSGKTSQTLKVTASNTNNGCLYRCRISNWAGSVYSKSAKLTVTSSAPWIEEQPKSVTVSPSATATFKVVGGGESLKYQWQVSKDGGSTWSNINSTKYPSAKTDTLMFTAASSMNGYYYRCKITNGDGSVTSSKAKLTVKSASGKPVILTNPENQILDLGEMATFSVTASNAVSYQWQYSKDNGKTWTTWSGKTSATVSVAASKTNNGCLYRCKVTNSNGSVYSSAGQMTVRTAKPVILTSPSDMTVSAGQEAGFEVVVGGWGFFYEWMVSKDGGNTWTVISYVKYPSAETEHLTFTAKASMNGYQYRCRVYNPFGVVYSGTATLTVK